MIGVACYHGALSLRDCRYGLHTLIIPLREDRRVTSVKIRHSLRRQADDHDRRCSGIATLEYPLLKWRNGIITEEWA